MSHKKEISKEVKQQLEYLIQCLTLLWNLRKDRDEHKCFNLKCKHGTLKDYRFKKEKKEMYCPMCLFKISLFVDTLFENLKFELPIALKIIMQMLESPNGIASTKIAINFNKAPDTALNFMHKVREQMGKALDRKFENTVVEVDEVYVKAGQFGLPEYYDVAGDGSLKVAVISIAQRNGTCMLIPVKHVDEQTVLKLFNTYIDKSCTIYTDTNSVYNFLRSSGWKYHETVNHSKEEFVRDSVSINNSESLHDRLRNTISTYTHVSYEKLRLYCFEAAFKHSFSRSADLGLMDLLKSMSKLSEYYNEFKQINKRA